MPPDSLAQRLDGQRTGERLPEQHQLLQLLGSLARQPHFAGSGLRFRLRLAAVGIEVEDEHHGEDQECRKQLDAVGAFNLSRDVEAVLNALPEEEKQCEGEPEQQQAVVAACNPDAHRAQPQQGVCPPQLTYLHGCQP
jgi:hypothetical protein